MQYECTTYRTMCPSCRTKYNKLINAGVPSDILEYAPETYPIVFKCLFEFPRGTFAQTETYAHHVLGSVKQRLNRRFNKDLGLYTHYAMCQETQLATGIKSGVVVRVTLLVDFPCEGLGDERFLSSLRGMTNLTRDIEDWSCRIEVEEGLKEFLFEGLGGHVDDWEAFITATQDHLCKSRLCWFMRRQGLVDFI